MDKRICQDARVASAPRISLLLLAHNLWITNLRISVGQSGRVAALKDLHIRFAQYRRRRSNRSQKCG